MNLNLLKTSILILLLSVCACKEQVKTKKTDEGIIQDAKHWVVLNQEDANLVAETYSWDFTLNRKGKYDFQIVCEGELEALPSEVTIKTGEIDITDTPKKTFVIEDKGVKQTIFQFGNNIAFKDIGEQTLKVETAAKFSKIRLMPFHRTRLGFGSGKYDKEWETMHNSPEKKAALNWFKEAKYGMFIHWGVYSQAGGIWKGERMEASENIGPKVSEWLMFKFQISREEYAELAKTFNPDTSFAKNIAKLAKDAGMKYIVITSKHHDGFALFDSKTSEFDMVDATPYKADAIKELYDACLEEGIEFGVYYSHGNDWRDGTDGNYANVKKVNDLLGVQSHLLGKNFWDPSPNTHAEYIQNKALPQVKELLDLLPKLRLVWFDGDGYITEDQAYEFYKTIYDFNPNIIVSRRVGYDFGDYLDAGDNVIPSANEKLTKQWETCGTTNNSWAYKSYDKDFKSTQEMLYYLVDIASKGGNYLLNIGPDGKGNVPEQSASGLREIGDWLKVNGEAIYGTTRWKISREGQDETLLSGTEHRSKKGFSRSFSAKDFWFTTKANKVYVISLKSPEGLTKVESLKLANAKVEKVSLLGSSAKLLWKQTETSLEVDLSDIKIDSANGYALQVILKE